ncbi:hypothetical protein [Paraburkholderia sp. RL17-337-BIB-A]|uniref:hypothetical protein n=1 Tax=Paraburkholderia sp. RL17-337-BIB-A TaxID=3031636 RepID=UPI0038BD0541
MHAKKRNGLFSLYRSKYVRKGSDGNTHGYSAQEFVGSLPVDALEIPVTLAAKLSSDEIRYVEDNVILPAVRAADKARQVAEQQRRDAEIRERDPQWRLEEALRLLTDAGGLVLEAGQSVDARSVNALSTALAGR